MTKKTASKNVALTTKTASPQIRILLILEHLAVEGPTCLNDLVENLEIPRSSVFRALKTLEETGWVTTNHGNTVYFATDAYLSLSKNQTHFPRTLPQLHALMKHLQREKKVLSDALFITAPGRLRLIETTVRHSNVGDDVSLTSGIPAAAAMATLAPTERLETAKLSLTYAMENSQSVRRVEGFSRHLRAIARDGYLWGSQRDSIALPMIDKRGFHGALVLHITKATPRNSERLQETVNELQQKCLNNKHARLGLFRTFEKDATQHLAAQ